MMVVRILLISEGFVGDGSGAFSLVRIVATQAIYSFLS
jgi:hypothetical protein